ncbi:MAG TPA: helix-turn-helix transcriptional regulator [Thermoanaerobaculia bacterium]|nr:helix-turn-helix transcriptional regulator [Thermoanaerobaculia bacterium]
MSTVQLQQGEHFGVTTARGEARGVLLSCLRHAAARKLPRHVHEAAFFTMLLRGGYRERAGSRAIDYDPLTVVFHPPSLAHFDEIAAGDSLLVTMEVAPRFMSECDLARPSLAPQPFASARRLLALYRAARGGVLQSLDIESAAIELLASAAKTPEIAERAAPPWLDRAIELLREETNVRVADLAREANVHPVHFARVFRRFLGVTPGAYLQRVRLQHALRLLGRAALAEVALSAGFADQSHFCRAVRAHLGLTPRDVMALLSERRRPGG